MTWRDGPPTQGLPVVSPANMVPVQVVRREIVAPGVVTVFIVLPGTNQAPAPYLPGQFVTLALPTPRETLYRSYSLCGSGDPSEPWELTIKHMEMGAVSTYFFNSVFEGTLLYASLPRGTFTLPSRLRSDMRFVFIAAGSGITPIMGMLRAIANMPSNDRPLVQLHYASKSPQEIIFGRELHEMDPGQTWLLQYHYLSSERNRMTSEAIVARAGKAAAKARWYMCGPESLKQDLQTWLTRRGVPANQVHSEVFATKRGPAYRVEASGGTGVGGSLHVAETGAVLEVQANETLLTALERQGYRPDFSCRAGACGACKLKVLEGQVDPVGEALSAADRAAGYVLSCIARPIGDVKLASGGRPPKGAPRVAAVAGGAAIAAAGRSSAVLAVRAGTLVGMGALLLGTWNLTNHRPSSWGTVTAAPVTTQQVSGKPGTAATTPGATTTTTTGKSSTTPTRPPAAPTSTTASGGGGAPPPAPTATPTPKPTTAPAPTPTTCVATSTTKCP